MENTKLPTFEELMESHKIASKEMAELREQ